jgi:hypothetical protein
VRVLASNVCIIILPSEGEVVGKEEREKRGRNKKRGRRRVE